MAIRITTTHIWTKLFIPVIWVSRLIALCIILPILGAILPDNTFGTVMLIASFLGIIIVHSVYVEQWYHILQTYLYIRINLGTKIYLNEAKHFLLLFAPTDEGVWYPMTGIKELPKNYRRSVLFDSARKIYTERGYQFATYKSHEDTSYKHDIGNNESNVSTLPKGFPYLVAMLCKMAKSDGLITKEEIEIIDDFFKKVLNLKQDDRKKAAQIFKRAKVSSNSFEFFVRKFYEYHKGEVEFLEVIVTLLTIIAFVDGKFSAEEEILLNEAISIFGAKGAKYYEYKSSSYNATEEDEEKKYAKILGLEDGASPENIKSAYRRLVIRYHPDKVSHLGAKIIEVAELEMKKINEAYSYFKKKYSM